MVSPQPSRSVAVTVAIVGASAVLLGAAGAHALPLDVHAARLWHLAVGYQFWHALAFTVAAFAAPRGLGRRVALVAFALGIVFFCGSLYALALGAPARVGVLTPIGGLAFVVGWLGLAGSIGGRPATDPPPGAAP